jgi:RNA polymerase sigma-70 factor, ECF subfamily
MTSRAAPDTSELLARSRGGDGTARSQLLERHRDQLRRMVEVRLDRRMLSRLDPSDVVQEALVEASQKLSDYLHVQPVAFYPWLRRLTWEHLVRLQEQHLTARRRSVFREAFSLSSLPDESVLELADQLTRSELLPDHRILDAELKSRVQAALAQLPERDRELLVLRYLEQVSNADIASLWNCSEGAIRTRHTRALAKLVSKLRQQPD